MVQTELKTLEVPQLHAIDHVVDISVEVPWLQSIRTVGDVPVVVQRQIPMVQDEVVSLMAHERVQQRTVEPIIDVPILQSLQEGANDIEALHFQVRSILARKSFSPMQMRCKCRWMNVPRR